MTIYNITLRLVATPPVQKPAYVIAKDISVAMLEEGVVFSTCSDHCSVFMTLANGVRMPVGLVPTTHWRQAESRKIREEIVKVLNEGSRGYFFKREGYTSVSVRLVDMPRRKAFTVSTTLRPSVREWIRDRLVNAWSGVANEEICRCY